MKNSSDKPVCEPDKDLKPAKNVFNKAASIVPKYANIDKIEFSSKAKDTFEKATKFVAKSPRLTQIIAGGGSGWISGFLTTRVGKTFAVPLGGSMLILGAANSMGITTINWEKFGQWTDYCTCRVQEKFPAVKGIVYKDDGKFQPMFMTGFAGGFLLGLTC